MAFPTHRPRRLREQPTVRKMVQETRLTKANLIFPLFVDENLCEPAPISAMPGQCRWPISHIPKPVEAAKEKGIQAFLLFGVPKTKDSVGSSARSENGVVPTVLRSLNKEFPGTLFISDICLCAYTDHGHCGMLDEKGSILNDKSLPLLTEMAVQHARAGSGMIAPSDMMDGRIQSIRTGLDQAGFSKIPIMAYSAKYASSFYGPFREAADSSPQSGDRKGYQMAPANRREALYEMELDWQEGADILMVKPAMPYLDIIREARNTFSCPIAAYQVSGEFSMIKAAAAKGWMDEKSAILESLTSIHRAGADLIISYFSPEVTEWLND